VPIRRLEALELADVLGSLLASVIAAQAEAARATVAFVEDVGFETTSTGDRLRTVSLRYRKKDETGAPAEFEVEVPLLALVNVPALAVKQAKLAFAYDVVTAGREEPSQPPTGPLKGRLPAAKLTGFVRRMSTAGDTAQQRQTTSIDLDVTLEQQVLPVGVERLFDLAELGITEGKIEGGNP
jgi:Protein of unknown function (DUF2589)